MKKRVITVAMIILPIALLFAAYSIDIHRMKKNEKVLFSTWGYDYAPPERETIKNEESFVATVVEETTTYMIVKPAGFEPEGEVFDRIKIDYGTDHLDYLYGIGRKVVIYYNGKISESSSESFGVIESDDISTEGFREFELLVKPSETKEKRHILEIDDANSYSLYYYGVDEVNINVDGDIIPLDEAIKMGKITLWGIISKCNADVAERKIPNISYKGSGTMMYVYAEYTIIRYHTNDGNRDVYIGSPDMDIIVANLP